MRSRAALTLSLLVLAAATTARADQLLWDNYPDGIQDATVNMSSERNTQVIESTWVVDDVDIAEALPGIAPGNVSLTDLTWIGSRNPNFTYDKADVIILDTYRNTMMEILDLDYSYVDLDPDPNPAADAQTYEATLSLAELEIELPGDHFYIGVRLVGDNYFLGRNQTVTSSIDSTSRGRTEGFVKGAIFGAPTWTVASDLWYGGPTPNQNFEFAFRLNANVTPEPTALSLLVIGGLVFVRRR